MVEEGEQRPVQQPGAVLQLCEGVVEQACVDLLFDLVDLLDGAVPVDGEDLAGQLAPCGLALLVVVGGLGVLLAYQFCTTATCRRTSTRKRYSSSAACG